MIPRGRSRTDAAALDLPVNLVVLIAVAAAGVAALGFALLDCDTPAKTTLASLSGLAQQADTLQREGGGSLSGEIEVKVAGCVRAAAVGATPGPEGQPQCFAPGNTYYVLGPEGPLSGRTTSARFLAGCAAGCGEMEAFAPGSSSRVRLEVRTPEDGPCAGQTYVAIVRGSSP